MKINNNRLFDNDGNALSFQETANHGGMLQAKYLVIHYTASPDAKSAIRTFLNPQNKVSAHIVVDTDGSITQLVNFDTIAWHAGESKWRGLSALNNHSIGIEIANPGWLKSKNGEWHTSFGEAVSKENVVPRKHKNPNVPYEGWHAFTTEQVEVVYKLSHLLVDYYEIVDIVGHDDIAPARKQDPGPAFPLEQLRLDLMGSFLFETSDDAGEGLNIRAGAGVAHATVAQPLPRGTKVKILDADGYWWRVRVQSGSQEGVEGWVHGNYLQHAVQAADPQPA